MEDYLDPLEHEWESVSAKPDDEFRPEALTALEGFHSKWSAGKSTFPSFRTPYYEARKDLMKLLANRRTGIEPAGRDRGSSTPRA
jgi:hypothetical protein